MALMEDLDRDVANVGPNGGLDVNIQDQTSPTIIVRATRVDNTTTLSQDGVLGALTVTVTSTTGFIDGATVRIISIDDNRFYTGVQVGAIAGSVVTLDSPLDFAFPAGARIVNGTTNMAVDGSSTTQIFSLRAGDPGIPLVVDITRMIFSCITTSAVDLSKFANFTALANGLVLRRVDGTYQNIFNVKTNQDIAGIMYDWQPYAATNPQQGVDGFAARLTFGGQSKVGVVLRLGPGEDLQLLVQDDLATAQSTELITDLHVTFEGHVVVEE